MQHIDDRNMDAYASGRLPEPLVADAEEHLLICLECQERLVQADEFMALFRQAVQEPAASRVRWWSLRPFGRTAAWAGALAVAVLAVVVPLQVREGPPSTITLRSLRGPDSLRAKSRTPLRLVFDVPASDAGRVQIVDRSGKRVVEAASAADDGWAVAKVPGLARGTYWVRIYGKTDPSQLLSEYGLVAE